MKIAYCLVGHARTWESCYQNFFDNVHSVVPGDIFISTWNTVSQPIGSHWTGWKPLTEKQLKQASTPVNVAGIYEAYKPKSLLIGTDKQVGESKSPKHRANLAVKNCLRQLKQAYQLVKDYDSYDVVFCSRMDISYTSKLSIEELSTEFLMTPEVGTWVADVWVFGPTKLIDIKINYIDHIDAYWDFEGLHEHAIQKYLLDKKVPLKQSSLEYDVPRIF